MSSNSSKIERQLMEQLPKGMQWNRRPIYLELNKNGQYILPFSRRVIDINLPWLIKGQTSSLSMMNSKKHSHIYVDVNLQEEKEVKNKDLYIIDKRNDTKYRDNIFECRLDDYGNPDMSDPRAWHRLYDEYYDDDDDDDDSINPFEIYD